jgi:hypothetical protein
MNILETIKNNDILKIALILVIVYLFMTYYKETLDNTPIIPSQKNIPNDEIAKLKSIADTFNKYDLNDFKVR